jgi:hypothetical protein
MSAERRYALRKVRAGDYLLLTDRRQALWRVQRYEDGPSYGLDDWPRDRTFWRVLRWSGQLTSAMRRLDSYEVDDLDRWHETDCMLGTRCEAIGRVLDAETPQARVPGAAYLAAACALTAEEGEFDKYTLARRVRSDLRIPQVSSMAASAWIRRVRWTLPLRLRRSPVRGADGYPKSYEVPEPVRRAAERRLSSRAAGS